MIKVKTRLVANDLNYVRKDLEFDSNDLKLVIQGN